MPHPKTIPGRPHTARSLAKIRAANTKWTDAEVARLREWYAARADKPLRLDSLSPLLGGRSKHVLSRKARELGLTNRSRPTGRVPRVSRRKYPSDAERFAAKAAEMRGRHAEKGHPMLGKHHTTEARQKISKTQRALSEAGQHPSQRREFTEAQRKVLSERAAARLRDSSGPYSSARRGYRLDLGPIFFRSRWEANYARYLKYLQDDRQILRWEFEPDTFWFEEIRRGVRSYTPDFKVWRRDGSFHYIEVKGWVDAKSKTKIARMARYHPNVELVVFGEKEYTRIERTIAGAIPHWEFPKSETPIYTKEEIETLTITEEAA